ncbi:MAG: hypothetical protein EXS37_18225 [Opitutus sp.]|nr:hypothetical protein [Opitutus sp.]
MLGVGLVSYLQLSKTALKLSHRTLFVNDAGNLAEAGLEQALYCFNQMNAGVGAATAWAEWTLSGATARSTLTQFNRDQNAIGTVKVFVNSYNSGAADPFVLSQATITPFDGGAPIVKVLRIGMKQAGVFINGVVGLAGLSLKGQPVIDSFNSNPTNSPTGPWVNYSAAISGGNTSVIVKSGTIDLGNGLIKGNVNLGAGVAPPPAAQVTGTIQPYYSGQFAMPAYPTAASVSKSYTLGSTIPAQLPVSGHTPAADGRYYYFVNNATITNTTIAAGANVIIVGTTTSLSSGLNISANATCAIFIDGVINASSQGSLNNSNWAGALQIFTTTATDCTISGNGELRASVYAPNASLKASGGGSSGSVVGSYVAKTIVATGQMSFHYDEALRYLNTVGGSRWGVSSWQELRAGADLSALIAETGGFLP